MTTRKWKPYLRLRMEPGYKDGTDTRRRSKRARLMSAAKSPQLRCRGIPSFCHVCYTWIACGYDGRPKTMLVFLRKRRKRPVCSLHTVKPQHRWFLSSVSEPQPHFPYWHPPRWAVVCYRQTQPDGGIFTQQRVRSPGPTQQGEKQNLFWGLFWGFFFYYYCHQLGWGHFWGKKCAMTQIQLCFVRNQKAAHEHVGQKRLCLRRRIRLVNSSAAGQGDAQQWNWKLLLSNQSCS